MIYQKDRVKYGTTTISYNIIKTRRVKTSEVIVEPNSTITVRTPIEKSRHEIQRIVLNKARWILQKQREIREKIPDLVKPTFKDNSTLPYLGKNYPLVIKKNKQQENDFSFINGEFVASVKLSGSTKRQLKHLYETWLSDNAQIILNDNIEKWSQQLGVKVERIIIKNLKKRWGSLTKDMRTINLNLNLLKAPESVIDYIILHELCHVRISDHSHHYWSLVHRYMPRYQEKISWLDANASVLV